MKPVVQRTFVFEQNTYTWLLCEKCKERPSFQGWDMEEPCQ
jgi:hypothetical protein